MEIVLFILFVVAYITFRILQPKIKGYIGEKSVAAILSFLPSDKYKINNDALIKSNDRTIQIDHLLISLYRKNVIPSIGPRMYLVININFIIRLGKIKLIFPPLASN